MAKKPPAFSFYAKDYLVDTLRWSRDMKSLHIDLMAESWINGSLQNEKGYPFGLNEEDKKIWDKIKHKWVLENEVWYNERLEEEREKKNKFIEHQAVNGKKGGRPKKPNENPKETQAFSEIEANEKPLVNCNSNIDYSISKTDTVSTATVAPVIHLQIEELGSEKVSTIARQVWDDQRWRENMCMGNSLNVEQLKQWMAKFNASVCNDKIPNFTSSSYKKMLQGWIVSKISQGISLTNPATERKSNSAPLQRLNP